MAQACRRHGKWAGTVTSPEGLPELMEEGYRFFGIGPDVCGLWDYCRRMAAAVEAAG